MQLSLQIGIDVAAIRHAALNAAWRVWVLARALKLRELRADVFARLNKLPSQFLVQGRRSANRSTATHDVVAIECPQWVESRHCVRKQARPRRRDIAVLIYHVHLGIDVHVVDAYLADLAVLEVKHSYLVKFSRVSPTVPLDHHCIMVTRHGFIRLALP